MGWGFREEGVGDVIIVTEARGSVRRSTWLDGQKGRNRGSGSLLRVLGRCGLRCGGGLGRAQVAGVSPTTGGVSRRG